MRCAVSDHSPYSGPLSGQAHLDRMLIVVLALVGAATTIVLSMMPVALGADSSPAVIGVIGSVNIFGYVAVALLAARGPVLWSLVCRLCLMVVAISAVGAVAPMAVSDTSVAGTSFLVALSSLMAFVILGYAVLDRQR